MRFPQSLVCAVFLLWLCANDAMAVQLLTQPEKMPNETKQVVREMLETHWSIKGAQTIEPTFAEAQPKSLPVLLGYALNHFRFGDVKTGLEVTQEINQRFPGNLDGWMLTTWFRCLRDDYDESLIAMRTLIQTTKGNLQLSQAKQRSIYRRLGRLIGYLEGPVNSSVNADLLDAAIIQVEDNLAAPMKQAFQKARNEVKQSFAKLLKEHQLAGEKELAKAKIVDDQKIERLKQDNQRLSETRTRLEPRKETIQSQANSEINQLQQQADSAIYQLNQANATVAAIERDLLVLYSQLNFNRANGLADDFFLVNQIRQSEFSLFQARNNAFSQGSQVATLQNQIQRTQRGYSAQISQLDAEISQAQKSMRRNDGKLNRLAKGPRIADGKLSGRENRRTSLRTYDDLSLELYRSELLQATTR